MAIDIYRSFLIAGAFGVLYYFLPFLQRWFFGAQPKGTSWEGIEVRKVHKRSSRFPWRKHVVGYRYFYLGVELNPDDLFYREEL